MAAQNGTAARVVEIALGEVGYLEKATNSQLDSKTANAGYNNYTKYNRDCGLVMARLGTGATRSLPGARRRLAFLPALSRLPQAVSIPETGTRLEVDYISELLVISR